MFRALLVALFFSGHAYAAPTLLIKAGLPADKPLCPFSDSYIDFTYTDAQDDDKEAVLNIKCAAAGANQKTDRFTSSPLYVRGNKVPFPAVGIDEIKNATTGDKCTATVTINGDAARSASGDFTIGFKRVGHVATPKVTSPITVGVEFRIENLFQESNDIPLWDLLLRECTAAEDPWVMQYHNNKLRRVYPISVTSEERFGALGDINPNNDNRCLGLYDGFIGGLFTIGSDYAGCKLKLVKEAVEDGNSFTAAGAPSLDSNASITTSAGKILLKTGVKPSNPAGVDKGIIVYVSNNRGQTWKLSKIKTWTKTATDTGIAVSVSNPNDNTINMALIAITNSTKTKRWWRIVKG